MSGVTPKMVRHYESLGLLPAVGRSDGGYRQYSEAEVHTLRFIKPVGIGDTIQARLTCKRKIDRNRKDAKGVGQGVVAWDVEVTNQSGDVVASYDILTLVAKSG